MKYLSVDEIKKAFADHLMKHRGYTAEEADMAVFDFPDPYSNCYLDEEYEGSCEIEGIAYEKNITTTALWRVGMHNVPDFRFYTYYREEDIESHTVGAYMNARKLFRIADSDEEDLSQEFEDMLPDEE